MGEGPKVVAESLRGGGGFEATENVARNPSRVTPRIVTRFDGRTGHARRAARAMSVLKISSNFIE